MKNIPTIDLIRELNSRDLLAELSAEKRDWLEKNGFQVSTDLQFINIRRDGNQGYSLEYLLSHSIEEIKEGDAFLKI